MRRVAFTGKSLAALLHTQEVLRATDYSTICANGLVFGYFMVQTENDGAKLSTVVHGETTPLELSNSPSLPKFDQTLYWEHGSKLFSVMFKSADWSALTGMTQAAGYAKEKDFIRDALRCYLSAVEARRLGGTILMETSRGTVGTVNIDGLFP